MGMGTLPLPTRISRRPGSQKTYPTDASILAKELEIFQYWILVGTHQFRGQHGMNAT